MPEKPSTCFVRIKKTDPFLGPLQEDADAVSQLLEVVVEARICEPKAAQGDLLTHDFTAVPMNYLIDVGDLCEEVRYGFNATPRIIDERAIGRICQHLGSLGAHTFVVSSADRIVEQEVPHFDSEDL